MRKPARHHNKRNKMERLKEINRSNKLEHSRTKKNRQKILTNRSEAPKVKQTRHKFQIAFNKSIKAKKNNKTKVVIETKTKPIQTHKANSKSRKLLFKKFNYDLTPNFINKNDHLFISSERRVLKTNLN